MAKEVTPILIEPQGAGLILVTGATGFVGSALITTMVKRDHQVRACVRRRDAAVPGGVQMTYVPSLAGDTDWTEALRGCRVVVHAAARVHVMKEHVHDSLGEFRRINVLGTLQLARQAAMSGVRRFVFVSSIKVNGEMTAAAKPFTADDTPAPEDAYGRSKMEAEQGLREIAAQSGMEVVIIRPPLVYGPGVRANFAALMRAARRGIPLPFAALDNRRSLVGVDNLVDLILLTITHPRAANQVFLVSDGDDLSTPELVRKVAQAIGRPARLVSVPAWALRLLGAMTGTSGAVQRLCGNLQVDISKAKELLDWAPPFTVAEGMKRTVSSA